MSELNGTRQDFSQYLYETRHKQCEKSLKYTFEDMVEFWEHLLVMFLKTQTKPNGEKATAEEVAKAEESLFRIHQEIKMLREQEQS